MVVVRYIYPGIAWEPGDWTNLDTALLAVPVPFSYNLLVWCFATCSCLFCALCRMNMGETDRGPVKVWLTNRKY